MDEKQIALVIAFYGKLPFWFKTFLLSCSANSTITWLIFTDLIYEDELPKNVLFKKLNKEELTELIFEKTGINHNLDNPYKLCDFKPLYGLIFENYLTDYRYWGHCDMDIVWGDLNSFLSTIQFQNYDIISTRKHAISGHLTLYKNKSEINKFFRLVPNYQKAFTDDNYQGFDEGYFSYYLFWEVEKKHVQLAVFWPDRNCIDREELNLKPNGWYWENGEIKNKSGVTGPYLHLIDWKKSMSKIPPVSPQKSDKLYINQYGIWREIPLKIKMKTMFNLGIRERMKSKINSLKSFIKHKLLGRPLPKIEANVIEDYRIL